MYVYRYRPRNTKVQRLTCDPRDSTVSRLSLSGMSKHRKGTTLLSTRDMRAEIYTNPVLCHSMAAATTAAPASAAPGVLQSQVLPTRFAGAVSIFVQPKHLQYLQFATKHNHCAGCAAARKQHGIGRVCVAAHFCGGISGSTGASQLDERSWPIAQSHASIWY